LISDVLPSKYFSQTKPRNHPMLLVLANFLELRSNSTSARSASTLENTVSTNYSVYTPSGPESRAGRGKKETLHGDLTVNLRLPTFTPTASVTNVSPPVHDCQGVLCLSPAKAKG